MPLPDPEEGLVVSYEYLWRWQEKRGNQQGMKDRPAVVVLVSGNRPDVLVVPITTQPAGPDRDTIEVPARVASHLGLDTARTSRIVVDEVNIFHWPNDLRPVPGKPSGTFHYGFIPPKLYEQLRDAVLRNHNAGKLATIKRNA